MRLAHLGRDGRRSLGADGDRSRRTVFRDRFGESGDEFSGSFDDDCRSLFGRLWLCLGEAACCGDEEKSMGFIT